MVTLDGRRKVKRFILSTLVILSLAMSISCPSGRRFDTDPKNSFAYHYNLGVAEFQRGNYRAAIEHFNRSIKLQPEVARTHNEIGMCYLFLGENEKAIPCFEKALNLDPNMAEVHNNLGIALYGLNRLEEAELHFKITVAAPEYATKFIPLYNLGNIYQLQERYNLALDIYKQALEEEAKITIDYRINIHQQLGNTYLKLDRHSDALQEYDTVLVMNPRSPDALYQAGECAYHFRDYDSARSYLFKLIAVSAGSEWESKARELLQRMEQ